VINLRDILEAAKELEDCTLEELTVLQVADPYRCDTPAVRRDAEWIAEQVARFAPKKQIHLRGLHYLIVAAGDVMMPNGKLYVNNDACYLAFLNPAAAAARWLGLVPFAQIIDNRNDPPVIPEEQPPPGEPAAKLVGGESIEVPDTDDLMPRFSVTGFAVRQPYRLVLFGEKSSLREELLPLAREFSAELIIASGENSLTLIYDMLRRAKKDGRPLRCFYFSDFDPAGVQMPVSTARKIQGMRDQFYPDLDLKLYKVALTEDQVIRLKLPDTPLKDGDRRSPAWRDRFGREATEIDALAALYPGELERMTREALGDFFDADLARNVADARDVWHEAAADALYGHPDYDTLREQVETAREAVETAVEELGKVQKVALDTLADVETPDFDIPEPDTNEEYCRCQVIFDTTEEFVEASQLMRAIKAYEE
jgi:hypothetical protein